MGLGHIMPMSVPRQNPMPWAYGAGIQEVGPLCQINAWITDNPLWAVGILLGAWFVLGGRSKK